MCEWGRLSCRERCVVAVMSVFIPHLLICSEIKPIIGSKHRVAWHRAISCVIKLHRRQPRAGGAPRWDRSRIVGSVRARAEYIEAYGTLLAKEAALLEAAKSGALELAGDVAKLTAGIDADSRSKVAALTVRALEARLLYEQLVDYRIEARLLFEANQAAKAAQAAAAAASSSSWSSWFTSPAPAPVAASAIAKFDAAARKAEMQVGSIFELLPCVSLTHVTPLA